jgi:hypothetical protein
MNEKPQFEAMGPIDADLNVTADLAATTEGERSRNGTPEDEGPPAVEGRVADDSRGGNDLVADSPYFSPRRIGASAVLDCDIWGRDFRKRLPEGHSARRENGDYEQSASDSDDAATGSALFHEIALRVTRVVR